ncbi:MAG TPA: hypothetical protein VFW80_00540 [Gaiellaceae bacterium]|nr:hypothetical protein [Gaiellaceae bacterium]
MRRVAAALVGILGLLVAACGGGGGERLSKAEFTTQANAICGKYEKQLKALDAPTSLEEVPDLVDKALAILNKEVDEISDLNPPEELEDQFDALIEQTNNTKAAADDLADAAKANDEDAVQQALDEGNAASTRADQIAGQLGLDACKG